MQIMKLIVNICDLFFLQIQNCNLYLENYWISHNFTPKVIQQHLNPKVIQNHLKFVIQRTKIYITIEVVGQPQYYNSVQSTLYKESISVSILRGNKLNKKNKVLLSLNLEWDYTLKLRQYIGCIKHSKQLQIYNVHHCKYLL